MREFFSKIFGAQPATSAKISGFSEFFNYSSQSHKKRVIEKVVRESNKDQRDLVKKVDKIRKSN